MKLIRVTVNGYRNIVDTTIYFDNVTSVLSLNNYGKSNLLSSIVFGISFMQQHRRTKQLMMDDVRFVPDLRGNNNENFSFEIECETEINNVKHNIVYSYVFNWAFAVPGKVISESLKIKDDSRTATTYIKRDGDGAFYKPSRTGRCATPINIDNDELILNKLLAFDRLYYIDILKDLQNINVYIDRHFDANQGFAVTFLSEQELKDLTLKPELNVPKTLYGIKQKHPEKFELIKNTFISLFPSISEIYVDEITQNIQTNAITRLNKPIMLNKEKNSFYLLFVKEKNLNKTINFLAMSDGARRILLLITFVVLAELNNYNLICIEEPENSIHPGLLKKFLYIIDSLAEKTSLLFSSHSPTLINCLQPENIYLGLPNDKGIAHFKKLNTKTNEKKRLLRDVESVDMQLGDYLFDLMSGTQEDVEELKTYVE